MKKIILCMALIVAQNGINAQELVSKTSDARNQPSIGVKIGVNYSNVYDAKDETFHSDPKFGFAIGGFVSFPLGKYLGIQPEVLYSEKGFKATGSFLGSNYEFTRTTRFIDIPVLLSFKPSEQFSIVAGPQYSFLTSRRDEFTNGTNSSAQENEFSNENYRKNLLSFTAGVDLNLDNIVMGLRGSWDLQNNNGDGTSTTPRYKNVWYQATIGVKF